MSKKLTLELKNINGKIEFGNEEMSCCLKSGDEEILLDELSINIETPSGDVGYVEVKIPFSKLNITSKN